MVAQGRTIVTLRCDLCHHEWAAELDSLPEDVQRQALTPDTRH